MFETLNKYQCEKPIKNERKRKSLNFNKMLCCSTIYMLSFMYPDFDYHYFSKSLPLFNRRLSVISQSLNHTLSAVSPVTTKTVNVHYHLMARVVNELFLGLSTMRTIQDKYENYFQIL